MVLSILNGPVPGAKSILSIIRLPFLETPVNWFTILEVVVDCPKLTFPEVPSIFVVAENSLLPPTTKGFSAKNVLPTTPKSFCPTDTNFPASSIKDAWTFLVVARILSAVPVPFNTSTNPSDVTSLGPFWSKAALSNAPCYSRLSYFTTSFW